MRAAERTSLAPRTFTADAWAAVAAVDNVWQDVAYGHAGFVACGQANSPNLFMTSVDGFPSTWTAHSTSDTGLNLAPTAIKYANGVYVSTNSAATTNSYIRTSTDGATFTLRTTPNSNSYQDLAYSPTLGRWAAIARSGTSNRAMTSDDNGTTWTAQTTPTTTGDVSWRGIAWGNGMFVAVSDTGTGTRVMTSPDGITWTMRTAAADNSWRRIAFGAGRFVAVAMTGTANRVMTSDDLGVTWTARDTTGKDNDWRDIAYAGGLFVVVGATGTGNRIMTSPDGITWTLQTSTADVSWVGVTHGSGFWVAVNTNAVGTARAMSSVDLNST